MDKINSPRAIPLDDGLGGIKQVKHKFKQRKETSHQEDTEYQVMMAWETFDDSTKEFRGRKPRVDETKIEDAEDDDFKFLWTEVEVPGDCYERTTISENVM